MDGVHPPALGQADDGGDVQIGPQGALVLTDEVGLVRPGAEEGIGVLVGVNGHGTQAQVVASPEYADGDLTPVGHHDLLKNLLAQWVSRPFQKFGLMGLIIPAPGDFCKSKSSKLQKSCELPTG